MQLLIDKTKIEYGNRVLDELLHLHNIPARWFNAEVRRIMGKFYGCGCGSKKGTYTEYIDDPDARFNYCCYPAGFYDGDTCGGLPYEFRLLIEYSRNCRRLTVMDGEIRECTM